IIAAVGTGVDDQIVITYELLKGRKGEGEEAESGSYVTKMKRAFFIVVASAATMIAAMSPLILIGFGLGKLVGFAITTIVGILVGVLITRPAFGEIAGWVMGKR
ncbi:MAG: preprotein translocase subunit SecD, partial [Candidatus Diapherotrites archaeon]|nr:preprotein translocase subunit SecD [Candidatus Diapherotrites archaeon]